MNYYPEQLRQIAAMCEALNNVDKSSGVSAGNLTIKNRIPVIDNEDDAETPLGYLIDEIGGAWSFEPVKDGGE